jgi:hypothetical protein
MAAVKFDLSGRADEFGDEREVNTAMTTDPKNPRNTFRVIASLKRDGPRAP